MAEHHLIDDYVSYLGRRLPDDAVDELADGLTETYRCHLSRGLDPDCAADTAIAEFGAPEVILAAFVRESAGRRMARALLYTGPLVGCCWAASLVAGHAWAWPVPTPLKVAVGIVLIATIGMLAIAAGSQRSYRRTRISGVAGLGIVLVDATVLTTIVLAAAPLVWPMFLAIPASATRATLTARALSRQLRPPR